MSREDPAERALASLRSGEQVDRTDYDALRSAVAAYLRAAWPSLDLDSAFESADEAISRVVMRDPHDAPITGRLLPYVLRTARNLQVDAFRRRRNVAIESLEMQAEGEQAVEDREVLRLLDEQASLSTCRAALRLARDNRDMTVVRVVAAWLDLAQEQEARPRTQLVAETLEIPASTVNRALRRFRTYLDEVLGTE